MDFRQQGSGQQPRGGTLGDSRVRQRPRAAPLLAATAAASAASEPQPAAKHTLWHRLRWQIQRHQLYVGNPEFWRDGFRVACAECDDALPVAVLNRDDELLQRPQALVLGCGHIFCYDCLERTRRNAHKEQRTLSCPVCKAGVQCQQCGHLPPWTPIPRLVYGPDCLRGVPKTLPEGGLPMSQCTSCRASEAWMAHGEHEVVHVLEEDQLEAMNSPMGAAVRRVLYRIMDDMEKEDEVMLGMEDVIQRLVDLAIHNVVAVWDQREDYLARGEAMEKAPCEAVCGGEAAMPARLGGLELLSMDEMLDGVAWEDLMMEGWDVTNTDETEQRWEGFGGVEC